MCRLYFGWKGRSSFRLCSACHAVDCLSSRRCCACYPLPLRRFGGGKVSLRSRMRAWPLKRRKTFRRNRAMSNEWIQTKTDGTTVLLGSSGISWCFIHPASKRDKRARSANSARDHRIRKSGLNGEFYQSEAVIEQLGNLNDRSKARSLL